MRLDLTNKEILEGLSKTVFGHEDAKKYLITAFNRLRAYAKAKHEGVLKDDRPLKTNILLVGDSGTGKTFMVTELAKLLSIPFIELDASKFTSSGSVSGVNAQDVERDIAKQLASAKSINTGKPDVAIIYIDEIDKLSTYYDGSSYQKWNLGVQGDFLKLIEKYSEEYLIVFSGAFDNLVGKTNKKDDTRHVGFHAPSEAVIKKDDLALKIQDAVTNFGFMPELLGRMGLVVTLDKLTEKDYIKLGRTVILDKLNKTLEYLGGKVKIPLKYIKKTAGEALESGQGVRYMKAKLSQYCLEREFDMSVVIKEPPKTSYGSVYDTTVRPTLHLKKSESDIEENYDKDALESFIKRNVHPDDIL